MNTAISSQDLSTIHTLTCRIGTAIEELCEAKRDGNVILNDVLLDSVRRDKNAMLDVFEKINAPAAAA